MNRLGTYEPAATTGGCDTEFAAKLVTLVRFTLADALYHRLVYTVDLVLVLALLMNSAGANGEKEF